MKFASLVKKWLAMTDTSREDAAIRFSVSLSSINHWLSGSSTPKRDTIRYICSVMENEMDHAMDRWDKNLKDVYSRTLR